MRASLRACKTPALITIAVLAGYALLGANLGTLIGILAPVSPPKPVVLALAALPERLSQLTVTESDVLNAGYGAAIDIAPASTDIAPASTGTSASATYSDGHGHEALLLGEWPAFTLDSTTSTAFPPVRCGVWNAVNFASAQSAVQAVESALYGIAGNLNFRVTTSTGDVYLMCRLEEETRRPS